MKNNFMVPSFGSPLSPIIIVGEAPGEQEIRRGKPFVGSAGRYLDQILASAGLSRTGLYITNVVKVKLPGNKIHRIPLSERQKWIAMFYDEINELPNPRIIVALGETALNALTDYTGINKYRGSILPPKKEILHDCIVIPTIHPSAMHWNYEVWPLIVADFMKVLRIANDDFHYEIPEYNFKLKPTFNEVMETLDLIKDKHCVVDVETPRGELSCIGFAWSKVDAICIPFFYGDGSNYWNEADELVIWKELARILPEMELSAQNALFDWEVFFEYGIYLSKPKWDSMLMHHCLYSDLPHKLDVITSIYTDVIYYKTDEDDVKKSSLKRGQEEKHWEYNCLDCVATFWSIEELEAELKEEGMMSVYIDLYDEVFMPVFRMNTKGVPVDVPRLSAVKEELSEIVKNNEDKIEDLTGYRINARSPQQVKRLLFDCMNMTPYKGETTDKKALTKLAYKYNSEVPTLIIDIRADSKMLSLFSDENIEDGCIRTSYSISGTGTGRFASKKTSRGRGMNLQNVKHGEARRFFIPEDGHYIIGADQKQAEAIVVAYLAQDDAMKALFKSGESIHIANAKNIFHETISKDDSRYRIAKALIHGGNYNMGSYLFGIVSNLPHSEAKVHLNNYHSTYPGIRNNFHAYVNEEITKNRCLYNPFGRRQVFFGKLEWQETFNAGYAFIPQSTIADVNKKALKYVDKYYRILLDLHDGLYISVPKKELTSGIQSLRDAYDIEFEIFGEKLQIPIELTYGENWEDMEEIE